MRWQEREKREKCTLTGREATVHLCLVYKGKNSSLVSHSLVDFCLCAFTSNLTHIRVRVVTFLGSCLGEFSEHAVRPASSQLNCEEERGKFLSLGERFISYWLMRK